MTSWTTKPSAVAGSNRTRGYSQEYEYLHVVPDVDLDINTQSVFFKYLADNFKPLHVLL